MTIPNDAANSTPLPPAYKPYDEVELCSNMLINVPRWFQIKKEMPILVGQGPDGPRLWLRGLVDGPTDWRDIVRDNSIVMRKIGSDAVTLVRSGSSALDVDVGGVPVLRCLAVPDHQASKLIVSLINLLPLHIGISGNLSGLRVGTMNMSANKFRNLAAAFSSG